MQLKKKRKEKKERKKEKKKKDMLSPSSDQSRIIECLRTDQNVCVDSVAGSGKTTTNLHIARAYPESQILLLTYNANLRLETRDRVRNLGITNMEVHTYHSYCVRYYDSNGYAESVFKQAVKTKPSTNKMRYDIIILDEAQDMTKHFFRLVWRILIDADRKQTKLCVVGDRNQNIYSHKGSSARFLTLCDKLFAYNDYPWVRCALDISFRITNAMATFINACLFQTPRIFSHKEGVLPKYIVCDTYSPSATVNRIYKEISHFLDNGYLPQDIFVLAPSVKVGGKSPITVLENLIKLTFSEKRPHVGIYMTESESSKVDEKILRNKMIFSTFTKTKGLERKIVFVYNFDSSYFQYYNTKDNPLVCPNILYVACTRASQHLILINGKDNARLPFLPAIDELSKYCQIVNDSSTREKEKEKDKDKDKDKDKEKEKEKVGKHVFTKSVTDLLKEVVNASAYVDQFVVTTLRPAAELINVPIISSQPNDLYEDVSAITGTCIPASYIDNFESVFRYLENKMVEAKPKDKDKDTFKQRIIAKVIDIKTQVLQEGEGAEYSAAQALQITNVLIACHTNIVHKVMQIRYYNWLSPELFLSSKERIRSLGIPQKRTTQSEYEVQTTIGIQSQDVRKLQEKYVFDEKHLQRQFLIQGFIDCVCEDTQAIYEFKFVSALTEEHYLQLAIYGFLYHTQHPACPQKKMYLYNIRSDELIQIEVAMDVMKNIVQDIILKIQIAKKDLDDEEFVDKFRRKRAKMSNEPNNVSIAHSDYKFSGVFGSVSSGQLI